ncbi:Crp/Fnr family transcriptional regulator [Micromonospora ureilytica]|uniref:Crp/Fnr family transcriptional regulator n=1 Tax=Micromonospora ureilytica TaxID=709868 RepID=UPI004039C7DA
MRRNHDQPSVSLSWPPGTLLGCLSSKARASLLALGTTVSVKPGDHILREGDTGSHLILLREAITKVTVNMTDGRQALLAIRVSGDVVGEISALNDTPRTATVTTCGVGLISVIHKRDWHPFLLDQPDAALALARTTAARFRWANQRRVDFTAYPAKIRLARVLAELSTTHGEITGAGRTVGVTLTQPELASLCGAAEPTVEKALRELRQAGVIQTGYRQIIVHDVAQLQRVGHLGDSDRTWTASTN